MKAVFFDRDGIVNRSPPEGQYVLSIKDFILDPDFPSVLRKVTGMGFAAVVVTNQRCVTRGWVTVATIEAMHDALRRRLLDDCGLHLLDVLMCPHGPGECDCRKPQPGMLLTAARRYDIELADSWMIGDRMTDVEAGCRAGCRTILVNPDPAAAPSSAVYRPNHVCPDMATLARRVEVWLEPLSS